MLCLLPADVTKRQLRIVFHTAAAKRKREADPARNVMAKAIKEAQLQCEEETKGFLKTAYCIAQNKLANANCYHQVKFIKEMECPSFKNWTQKHQAMTATLIKKIRQKCTKLLQVNLWKI